MHLGVALPNPRVGQKQGRGRNTCAPVPIWIAMAFLFGRFRAASNRRTIGRLNDDVIAAVRRPAFYEAGGVPDTFNGRFEVLVLHTALVVRRMRALPAPGPAAAQDLIDLVFGNLDPAMRELGVGDMAVPKRMKRLAEAFLGRSVAYDAALRTADRDSLSVALSRNVYADVRPADHLARYAEAVAEALDGCDLDTFLQGPVPFPDPAAFLSPS